MQRDPHSNTSPARSRSGQLRMLAFLLLAGLLWSWTQARAMPVSAADSELGYFITLASDPEYALPGAGSHDAVEVCRKPVTAKATPVERVLNEVGDLGGVQPRQPVWLLPAPAVPAQGPQPALQEAELRPLLRPPARLG